MEEKQDMRFEKADITDISQLIELRIAYLQEDTGRLSESDVTSFKNTLSSYFKRNLNKNIFGYVARDGVNIVSCALLLVVEKPCSPAFVTGKTGTVLNVYTKPEYRRKGHARKVMEMLLADAEFKNLSPVELKATDAGYPLYLSLGFREAASSYHLMKWGD